MAIDFPATPSNGQTFTSGSVTYTYDGTKWTAVAAGGGGGATDKIEEGNTSAEVIDTGSDGAFVVTTEGSERARVDPSGRLLVGTSTARSLSTHNGALQIDGDNFSEATLSIINNQNSSNGAYIFLGKQRSGSTGGSTIVQADDTIGQLRFFGGDGTDMESTCGRISCEVDGTPGANDMPGRLVFSTTADGASSPTERMRITQNGSVCINSTDTTMNTFGAIFTAASSPTTQPSVLNFSKTYSGSVDAVVFRHNGSRKGSITFNDTSTTFSTTSDYRVKENLSPLSDAVTRLRQLQVYTFNFINAPDTTVDGFLAHEAQAIVPECVTGTKDEVDDDGNPIYQGIDQSKLVPLLTAALQEAITRIETLEAKVNALEGNTPLNT